VGTHLSALDRVCLPYELGHIVEATSGFPFRIGGRSRDEWVPGAVGQLVPGPCGTWALWYLGPVVVRWHNTGLREHAVCLCACVCIPGCRWWTLRRGRIPVFLGRGGEAGTDVLKALALGAKGVFVSTAAPRNSAIT